MARSSDWNAGGNSRLASAGAAWAGKAELKGKYEILKDEISTHKPGKVQLVEFADFYCPHCHRFDGEGVPLLEKEFGKKLDVTMVGYPVMPGKLPTAFDMYEQAKSMGKGDEMKRVLFRIIHKDKIGIIDRTIREMLIREVGWIQWRLKRGWPAPSRRRPLRKAGNGAIGSRCNRRPPYCWTAISKWSRSILTI